MLFAFILIGADIGSPVPIEARVAELEKFRDEAVMRLSAIEEKLSPKVRTGAPAPLPKVEATPVSGRTVQSVAEETKDIPTWHYPPGTVMVRDANGVLVPSKPATHMTYQDGRVVYLNQQPAVQPQPMTYYAPRPMFMPSFGGFASNCGPSG